MEGEIRTTKTIDLSNRFFILVALLIIGVIVYYGATALYQFKTLPQNYPQQINVSGEGKAFVKPDIAKVNFGANTQGLKSQDVVDKNNQTMNNVIGAVKAFGVLDKDIQTTSYNLNPVYDYTEKGRVFKGYSLDQQISVKIRNFDKISNILDAAVTQGANTVGDLQFTVDDPIASQAEARAKAIAQAKEKATSIASQAGLALDKIINIQEGYAPTPQPMYAPGAGLMKDSAVMAPQIQTGQLEVDSTVTLTYLLK